MKTELEIQAENVKFLLKLIKENPDLKIVPMVDSDVVADDGYSSWMGSFGKAEIDYIWITDERIYFKSIDEEELIEEELDKIAEDEPNPMEQPMEQLAEERVKNYSWEKVIAVWITTP